MKTFAKYAAVPFVFFMMGAIITGFVFSSYVRMVERTDHVRGLAILEELIFSYDEKSGCVNDSVIIEKYEKMALMGPDFMDITVVNVLLGAYTGGTSFITESAYVDYIRHLKDFSKKKQQKTDTQGEPD